MPNAAATNLRRPPGPSDRFSPHSSGDPLRLLLQLTREYGDLVCYPTAYGPVYLVNRPEYIGEVFQNRNIVRGPLMRLSLGEGLLTSEGPYWRSQRRVMQPAFHRESIAAFDSLITAATIDMLEHWHESARAGKAIPLVPEMTHLTLRIISKALFRADAGDDVAQLCDAITVLTDDMGYMARTLFASQYTVVPSRNLRFEQAVRQVDEFAYGLIRDRRERHDMKPDLLSLLLAHAGDPGVGLSDRQVRDEIVTLFLAGHVTTANLLVWTWHLLSGNPAVECRLHRELAQVLGGRTPTVQDLPHLRYTHRVVQESLRLYPPVWFIARKNLADGTIGGYPVPAQAAVVISPYTMHRHPKFWEDAERFDPDRFAPDLCQTRPGYAYLPFGGGQHLCIGNHLAMLEGQLVIATIAQRYRVRFPSGQPVEPQPILTLKPPHDLMATLESRE